jgi:hypothetical protein
MSRRQVADRIGPAELARNDVVDLAGAGVGAEEADIRSVKNQLSVAVELR